MNLSVENKCAYWYLLPFLLGLDAPVAALVWSLSVLLWHFPVPEPAALAVLFLVVWSCTLFFRSRLVREGRVPCVWKNAKNMLLVSMVILFVAGGLFLACLPFFFFLFFMHLS